VGPCTPKSTGCCLVASLSCGSSQLLSWFGVSLLVVSVLPSLLHVPGYIQLICIGGSLVDLVFAGNFIGVFPKKPCIHDLFFLSTGIFVVWSLLVDPCELIACALDIPVDCLGCGSGELHVVNCLPKTSILLLGGMCLALAMGVLYLVLVGCCFESFTSP